MTTIVPVLTSKPALTQNKSAPWQMVNAIQTTGLFLAIRISVISTLVVKQSLPILTCVAPSVAVGASPIVATVNNHFIHADEVMYFLPKLAATKPTEQVWRAALDLAIDRRLVLTALYRKKKVVKESAIDVEIARLDRVFSKSSSNLDKRLNKWGISKDSFRDVLRWQLTWQRYLNSALTDENLKRYFQKYKCHFDGTEIRASHILLLLDSRKSNKPSRLAKANQIRAQIQRGEKSFAEAAQEYSSAPSAKSGGDVGWIERHKPMSAEFSDAVFGLHRGNISQPVLSSAGIHLIHCTDIKPGTRTWLEAREQLVESVQRYLFQWLADRERQQANVELP